MEVSILLPSLRPAQLKKCIERIYVTHPRYNDYEILVISPLDLEKEIKTFRGAERIRFIKETSKKGMHAALELGVKEATGKYIFVISDDQLLDRDALNHMSALMNKQTNKYNMTGTRCHNLWLIEPDQTIYGMYYTLTAFIRRDIIAEIGGLYDTTFRSYLGDTDLSLRIRQKGGNVLKCSKAWIETNNVLDAVNSERNEDWEEDYKKFFDRWDCIYGKDFNHSHNPAEVNQGSKLVEDEYIPELSSRIVRAIRLKDFHGLCESLICMKDYYFNTDNALVLFAYILANYNRIPVFFRERNFYIQQELNKLLLENLLHSNTDLDFNDILSKIEKPTSETIRNLLLTCYFHVVLRNSGIIKNYKNLDIGYRNNTFSIDGYNETYFSGLIRHIDEKNRSLPPIDYKEITMAEELFRTKTDLEQVNIIVDYFFNREIEERRKG